MSGFRRWAVVEFDVKLARADMAGRVTTAVVNGDAVISLEPLFGSGELGRSLDAIVRAGEETLADIAAFATNARPDAALSQVRLLAPLTAPRKIVAIGSNYPRPGAAPMASDAPPVLFFKPPTALCGPYDPILLPPEADLVIGEVELAVVIGRDGDRIPANDAMAHVFGLMVANDVTAPKILLGQSAENPLLLQQSRGKGFRTFCPTGPWIETLDDRAMPRMTLEQRVDDFLEIRGETSQMLVELPTLLADISAAFGLEAGDVVLTGSPPPLAGNRTPLSPGVTLYSSIEGLGELANPVQQL